MRNRLLAALKEADFETLLKELEPVAWRAGDILSAPGQPFTHVYFPESGMISLVQQMTDGTTIEVGVIGNEGFVGVPVLHGARTDIVEAVVQIGGYALRMTASAFRRALERSASLSAHLLRFAHALQCQIMQTAACNGRHSLEQRLARWLLAAGDRAQSDEFALSHEFLATMLGRRRAGVTVALAKMRGAGLIDAVRGHIAIHDRRTLEAAACECYRIVREEYRRLLG